MRILITAGPTWVRVDRVRILTNVFTGGTGVYLAKEFQKGGHKVTLILNPHCLREKTAKIKTIPFKYYDELKREVAEELRKRKYDAIIHSAAVSDYQLRNHFKGKIPSGKRVLALQLRPTGKIIKTIRKSAESSLVIQFKLEVKKEGLFKKACQSLKENKSDFVVAVAYEDLKSKFKALLIDRKGKVLKTASRRALFKALNRIIAA